MRPAVPSTTFSLRFLAALLCRIPRPSTTQAVGTAPNQWRNPRSIDITVTGRLTKDPELRKTQSGKLVTSFGLAHNFRERAGNQFNDVATVFFDANKLDSRVHIVPMTDAMGGLSRSLMDHRSAADRQDA
jgi:hypothetical protein